EDGHRLGVVAGAGAVAGAARPAPVLAALAGGLEVDLLARVLADVADVQIAGLAIEGHAVGVAQAVVPGHAGQAGGGHAGAAVGVEAQDAAVEAAGGLGRRPVGVVVA